MFEIFLMIGACVVMARIASADDQIPWLWGLVCAGLCFLGLLLPLPFLRVGIAAVLTWVAMIIHKTIKSRVA